MGNGSGRTCSRDILPRKEANGRESRTRFLPAPSRPWRTKKVLSSYILTIRTSALWSHFATNRRRRLTRDSPEKHNCFLFQSAPYLINWVRMDGSFPISCPVIGVQSSASQAVPLAVLSTVWNRDRVAVIDNVRIW